MRMRNIIGSCAVLVAMGGLMLGALGAATAHAAEAEGEAPAAPVIGQEMALFNGKDLTGWSLRNPRANVKWQVVSDVKLDPADSKKLIPAEQGPGAMLLPAGGGSDIMTRDPFGDCELNLEFMVPQGSNSGVYLMGRYEIQVLDSFGKKQLSSGDCGGIYSAAAPSTNASKPPGQWQSFEIVFRAPRFDAEGKKTANARFISVKHNGVSIHENVEVKAPTGGQVNNAERPLGPVLLQGDHGVVAFRNIRIKPLQLD
jgi:hypothetical protein